MCRVFKLFRLLLISTPLADQEKNPGMKSHFVSTEHGTRDLSRVSRPAVGLAVHNSALAIPSPNASETACTACLSIAEMSNVQSPPERFTKETP
jgi:hypothetical protein